MLVRRQALTLRILGMFFFQVFVQQAFLRKAILGSIDLTLVHNSNSGRCPTWHSTSLILIPTTALNASLLSNSVSPPTLPGNLAVPPQAISSSCWLYADLLVAIMMRSRGSSEDSMAAAAVTGKPCGMGLVEVVNLLEFP